MENSSKNQENELEIKISPCMMWAVLRELIKNNNKILSSRFAREFGAGPKEYSFYFSTMAESFLDKDKDAIEIYKTIGKRDWLDFLSTEDLFAYFNYQNKVLSSEYLHDILTVASNSAGYMGLFVVPKIYLDNANKQDISEKQFKKCFNNKMAIDVLLYEAEQIGEVAEAYYGKKIPVEKMFDRLHGFNLGGYQDVVMENFKIREEIVRKKEEQERKICEIVERKNEQQDLPGINETFEEKNKQERKTRETAEEEDEQPYLPGFEELFM